MLFTWFHIIVVFVYPTDRENQYLLQLSTPRKRMKWFAP